MVNGDFLYLDYAATAPISNAVMRNYYEAVDIFGNPAAFYIEGEKAFQTIKQSKQNILKNLGHLIGWDIMFTSGATESINTVFYSYQPDLIITTNTEHSATKQAIHHIKNAAVIELDLAADFKADPNYLKLLDKLENEPKKILISIVAVNNETGVIISNAQINSIKEAVQNKFKNSKIIVHLDFTQGFCKIPYDMTNIDCYSFSGHKIGFFKGFGGLVFKENTINIYIKENPLIKGGNQQNGLRSGTENPMFVYLFDKLVESYMKDIDNSFKKANLLYMSFKHALYTTLLPYTDKIDFSFNDLLPAFANSPYIINISILGVEGESLVSTLGNEIGISTGSACNDATLSGSTIIKNLYKPVINDSDQLDEYANSAIRISYDNTLSLDKIVDKFIPAFDKAINFLVRASTYKKGE
jgi:cysteine desulfurase